MKRIIELEEAPFVQHFENGIGETVYRVKGFNNIVLDKSDIDKLEPFEPAQPKFDVESHAIGFCKGLEQGIQKGREEMREAVIKLADDSTRICAFDGENIEHIFKTYKPETILGELAHFDKQKFDKDLSTLVEQYGYDGVTEVLRKMIESEKE